MIPPMLLLLNRIPSFMNREITVYLYDATFTCTRYLQCFQHNSTINFYCLMFEHRDGVLVKVQGLFLWSATNSQCTLLVSYLALYIFEHSQGFCWGCDFTKSVVSSICESRNKQWPLCQSSKKAQSPWPSSGFYALVTIHLNV